MQETKVVGVLNVTPNSFYDGGEHNEESKAVEKAMEMIKHGADIIDVGGESTKPGADPVTPEEEEDRVLPVVKKLKNQGITVSVDTRKPHVAEACLKEGADILNDVTALEKKKMRDLVAQHECRAILMDSDSVPVDRSSFTYTDEVVSEARKNLKGRIKAAEEAGIDREKLIVDPGIGFGKTPEQDARLIANLDSFQELGCDVMLGCSRKSFFSELKDYPQDKRLIPSLAANQIGVMRGAEYLRVHDVEETARMVKTLKAIESER
ncbi:MAG: dihydropteroate synthase [Candidatus Nanosalina sp. J07AB43]|nr:MAG: dihydropteroate synthase [Candidatus Nanosalina sp. J07AB43]